VLAVGLVGAPDGASLSRCASPVRHRLVFAVVWLGEESRVSQRCRRKETAFWSENSGSNARALSASAQR